MATPKPRIKAPKTAAPGEVVLIKTLISHEMESGLRKDKDGNVIPRRIINAFSCQFNGQPVFSAKIEPAVSANPYFEFSARVGASGVFAFAWTDDDGQVYTAEEKIDVA
jgi:sulfur-oxidizing protein SoxZ